MPLIFQKWITREDLRANPDVLYVFGDNEERIGLGGQAKEMRGEPNAVGVATKRKPGRTANEFWSDDENDRCCMLIEQDLRRAVAQLQRGWVVVFPLDGIGTGLSELPARAPRIMKFIRDYVSYMRTIEKQLLHNYYK